MVTSKVRFVARDENAITGSLSVMAIDGWVESPLAGAEFEPKPRLTRYVVPAVTSRTHTSSTPPVAAAPVR